MRKMRKEIRWLVEEKYDGNPPAGGAETKRDIERLERGEHVDYVIGWTDFAGCRIDLSKRPLIPRPETEFWVQKVIEDIHRSHYAFSSRPACRQAGLPHIRRGRTWTPTRLGRKHSARASLVRILDLFAGSGCIGVAVLKHIPHAKVDFAEKDRRLLKQIRINTKLNGISLERYRVLQSDVFSNVKGKYDYILANPPYVAEARKAKVQKSVLEQEPREAVFGGKDGLYYIRKFLKKVGDYLVPGGVVYIEFDSHQRRDIIKLAKVAGVKEVDVRKDQFGKWRYARIVF